MPRKALPTNTTRVVWRITHDAPMGEYVAPDQPAGDSVQKDLEAVFHGWAESSFDSLQEVDVVDARHTLSADADEGLFGDDDEWVILRSDHWHQ